MTSPSGTADMGGQRGPEEMRNSTRLWIQRDPSLPHDSWQPFIDWGTTQGRLSLPTADVLSTIVKRSMLTDVDKLSSCSRFSDSVVGFIGRKTQPTASKYWRRLHTTLFHKTSFVTSVWHKVFYYFTFTGYLNEACKFPWNFENQLTNFLCNVAYFQKPPWNFAFSPMNQLGPYC